MKELINLHFDLGNFIFMVEEGVDDDKTIEEVVKDLISNLNACGRVMDAARIEEILESYQAYNNLCRVAHDTPIRDLVFTTMNLHGNLIKTTDVLVSETRDGCPNTNPDQESENVTSDNVENEYMIRYCEWCGMSVKSGLDQCPHCDCELHVELKKRDNTTRRHVKKIQLEHAGG